MRYRALDASTEVVDEPLVPPQELAPAGTCMDCGGAIPAARLKAIPTAIRCTACQLQHESHTL
jgi:hypothetical protein